MVEHVCPTSPLAQGRALPSQRPSAEAAPPSEGPAAPGSLLACLRAEVNRAHVRKLVAERGWTQEIDHIANRYIHATKLRLQDEQMANRHLAQIKKEIHHG